MTVIAKVPVGVVATVVMVRVVEQVGLQEATEKLAEAPLGSPDAEKDTLCVAPAVSVAVMVLAPEAPWVTVMPPELVSNPLHKRGRDPVPTRAPSPGQTWASRYGRCLATRSA